MDTSFEKNRNNTTTNWLTPPEIIKALGRFDLDPCSPVKRPWDTAQFHYNVKDNGIKCKWFGRVWLNPPYGKLMPAFLKKMAKHNNGIALTFNRAETIQFAELVWPYASGVLFKTGRIRFHKPDGSIGASAAGCGSVFIAYGKQNALILKNSGIPGIYIQLKP